jgi:hypothetical protein
MRFLITGICISLFVTCQFPDFPDPIEIQINEKLRDFCFPIGEGATYIYIDTVSGETDTMILEKVDLSWDFDQTFKREIYSLTYSCSNTQDFRVQISTTDTYSQFQYFGLGGMAGHKILIDFEENRFYPESTNVIIDSLVAPGETYYGVLENSASSLEYSRFIFAKGIGIVLKESNPGFGQSFHRNFLLQKIIHP